jgi:hypothetical protein
MIAGYREEAPSVVAIAMGVLDGSVTHRYERFTDV